MTKLETVASAAIAAMTLLVSACAGTPTPYQPISGSSVVAGGYSEVRLAPDRYRVTFAGNRVTSRERVEASLLYRAADLTLEQGLDWFVIEEREIERRVERRIEADPFHNPWFYGDFGHWRPYWRFYGPDVGWRIWDPYYGGPFWAAHVDVRTVERFEVSAEVRMGRGAMPASNPRAFDARDVIARLRPKVRRSDR